MARMTTSLLMATALVATAACSKKPPKELPPAPSTQPAAPQGDYGNNEGQTMSSLAEQFRREVTSDTVHFGLDLYDIDAEAQGILNSQATWLAAHPEVRITIEGHCDERGTREYNLALGDRRANAARDYLQSRGVAPERMTTISWGKERPQNPASNEEAWAQNRRAVTVVPQ